MQRNHDTRRDHVADEGSGDDLGRDVVPEPDPGPGDRGNDGEGGPEDGPELDDEDGEGACGAGGVADELYSSGGLLPLVPPPSRCRSGGFFAPDPVESSLGTAHGQEHLRNDYQDDEDSDQGQARRGGLPAIRPLRVSATTA